MAEVIKTPDDKDIQQWIRALSLRREEVSANMNYDFATVFCFDCPRRRDENWSACCKENGGWEEAFAGDFELIEKIKAAQLALQALLPEE